MLEKVNKNGNTKQLLEEILKIPGDKIVTLSTLSVTFQVDIDVTGHFGYEPDAKALFLAKLYSALDEGGGIIIREFLSIRVERKLPNGKKAWIPEKNLYGVILKDNGWFGCTKDQVQSFHETDATTGEALPKEEGVHYQDFANSCKKL